MYEIDKNQTYRMIDVRDLSGNSKVETSSLYKERINCIAKHIRAGELRGNGQYRMCIDFIQDADGRWINRYLHTSVVSNVKKDGDLLEIYTYNSIYVLKKAKIQEAERQDAAELIELYLSNEGYKFCKGFYYDSDKKPHELVGDLHIGTFQDTFLIGIESDVSFRNYVCRYYVNDFGPIQFYDTLYGQQDYATRMLIHNNDSQPIQIEFEGYPAAWAIMPGETKSILPYRMGGTDGENN